MSMMGGRGRGRALSPKDTGPKAKFSQLVPYLMEHKGALWIAMGLSVLGAAISLAQPLVVGQVITAVQTQANLGAIVALLVTVVLGGAITGGFMYYVLAKAGEGVVFSARQKLAHRLLKLPIHEYDLRRTGDLVSRVGSDTTLLRAVLTQGLVDAVGGILIFVGSMVAMAVIDPLLLSLTLLMVVIAILSISVTARQVRSATTKAQQRVGDMSAAVDRALSAVRTIRAARAEQRESQAIVKDATEAFKQGVKIARINAMITPIAGLAMNGAFIVVLGVGGYRVATGATSVASLITFILLMFQMIRPLGQAFGAYSSVQSGLGALARIQEILDVRLEETKAEARNAEKVNAVNDIALEFKNVSFGYAAPPASDENPTPESRDVLNSVSFRIKRGSRVALVGPSGSGKSTTFSLIERFYEPSSGEILLDGQSVTSISRSALRSQIGYVEQDAPV
ncbi:MAG: ABC transporter ATP-binding protein, partial [Rhodoluna sp.]